MKNSILTLITLALITLTTTLFASNHCEVSETLHCGETITTSTEWGCSNNINNYGDCGHGFNGNDKVFEINKPSNEGRLTVNLFNNHGLDLFVLNECNGSHFNCLGSHQINSSSALAALTGDLPSGTYYAVVDALNTNAAFEITATCGKLNCWDAEEVYCRQWKHDSNTHAENNISAFKFDHNIYAGYTGNEKVYYFDINDHKTVTIDLNNFNNHNDFDLILLNDCDEYATIAKSNNKTNGHPEQIVKTLAPGRYYVLVEGYHGAKGDFSLHIDYDCCTDTYNNHCNAISTTTTSIGGMNYFFEVPQTSEYIGATWIIKGGQYGTQGIEIGTGFSTDFIFPTAGTYTVCVKTPVQFNPSCFNYCCKEITIEPACHDEHDYHCNLISGTTPAYGMTYEFSVPSTIEGGSWILETNGAQEMMGIGWDVTWTAPTFGTYTIIYKYRKHDGCYFYCYKTITVQDPCYKEIDNTCNNISFHYTGSGFGYNFNVPSTSEFNNGMWTITGGAFGQAIEAAGNNTNMFFDFPSAGRYTVTYIYTTTHGVTTHCCKTIWIDNPTNCDMIMETFNTHTGMYELSLAGVASSNIIEWRNLNNNQTLGTASTIEVSNPSHTCETITVTVFDPYGGCYKVCQIELCAYETCFEFDPFYTHWLGELRNNLSNKCHSFPGLTIETARYNGQCVIVVPSLGIYDGQGQVYDASGNTLFTFGGWNPTYNASKVSQLNNRNIIWSCGGYGLQADESNDTVVETAKEKEVTTLSTTTVATTAKVSNYPNPFTTETLISFTLPTTMDVQINIIDARGAVVFEMNGEFFEGDNEFLYTNDKNLPAGMYFLTIQGQNLQLNHNLVIQD